MKVLVAYATRHGATRGIAERIASTLQRRGLEVSLSPANQVRFAHRYGAFVIGSAAYAFHWLSEASELVRRERDLFSQRPTWLFSSGPIGPDELDAKGRDQRDASRPAEFSEFARLVQPRGMRVFFGAYDPDAPATSIPERLMKVFLRFVPSLRRALPAGDFRDWAEIEAWADEIATELQPAEAGAAVPA